VLICIIYVFMDACVKIDTISNLCACFSSWIFERTFFNKLTKRSYSWIQEKSSKNKMNSLL
jgi:hypothetical protein